MVSLQIRLRSCALPLLLLGLIGCGGGGPRIVKVSGTLSFKGKPVTNAYIDFIPVDGQRPSWGMTDEQGHFTLEYDDKTKGAHTGAHKVSIRMRPTTVAEQEAVMMGREPPMAKELSSFFSRYSAENTKIEINLDKDSKLDLNWD